MHTNHTCYIQSDQECQSQAAELSQSTAARFCCHISHPVPILWNMNRHRQWNARSHIFQQLTLTRFVFFFTFSSSLFLLRDSPVVNLLKVIRFSFETSLVKWDNYSDQAVPSRRCWIFLIICLRWMMPSCICISVVAAIHASCFFFVFFFPLQWTGVSVRTLGKRVRLLCPALQEGHPKLYPLPASTPTSPSEFDYNLFQRKPSFASTVQQERIVCGNRWIYWAQVLLRTFLMTAFC